MREIHSSALGRLVVGFELDFFGQSLPRAHVDDSKPARPPREREEIQDGSGASPALI